jgi:hypothetical protein
MAGSLFLVIAVENMTGLVRARRAGVRTILPGAGEA